MKKKYLEPLPAVSPFTVSVDGRERHPYQFHSIRSDVKEGGVRIIVPWTRAYLRSGDYSIKGYEDRVAIERKSLEDLYCTLGQHRERFEAEHERLAEMEYAAVVIEASWQRILRQPPPRSRLNPKTVFRTALSWSLKYGVPWWTVESRRMAEMTVYRLLEKWWQYNLKEEP